MSQVKYRAKKLMELTHGVATEDAYSFTRLAIEDVKNGGFFKYRTDEDNRFEMALYLSKTMLIYADSFLDIVIIDSTYRRNRFNLILVNIIGVNNYGQNLMLGFGLLSNETLESYDWLFFQLKTAWTDKRTPSNFITDEAESIRQGKFSFRMKLIF